jgi:hypothetical protein
MLTIFYCVRDKQTNSYRGRGYRVMDCPIRNTISSRETKWNSFCNLPEAISNISEIVDKIERRFREVLLQNLKPGWI